MDELTDGRLQCQRCPTTYEVTEGIPVLLPQRIPNPAEQVVRRSVSEEVATAHLARERYERHHFRARAELDIGDAIARFEGSSVPRVLDIGIGWGVPYLRYADAISLWGVDFSLESLLVAKRNFSEQGTSCPQLICASLDAIPIAGIRFDIARSVQVYQHIADVEAVRQSLRYVVGDLLVCGGELRIENLNYGYARWRRALRSLGPRGSRPGLEEETADYFLRHYLPEDYRAVLKDLGELRISYSELLFHPEFGLRPTSRRLARLDASLSRLPGAGLVARQIVASVLRGREERSGELRGGNTDTRRIVQV